MNIFKKNEQITAFSLFLLMFIITTSMLITAIFFNYKLPLKENETLKTENNKLKDQLNSNLFFLNKIEEINNLIDSLDLSSDENIKNTQNLIESKITQIEQNDSISIPPQYKKIITNTSHKIKCIEKNLSFNNSNIEIDSLRKKIKFLQEENIDLANKVKIYEIINKMEE